MESDTRVDGKTIIITGANTGIGKETARELAKRGGRIILACRNEEKANQTRDELILETGNSNIIAKILDLASFASIKRFAFDVDNSEERLDILVCNAGVATIKRFETEDHLELMFGVNHIGHFLLTMLLLKKLKKSAPSKVIIVASEAHELISHVDFNDLQSKKEFKAFKTYAQSKACNILFGVQLTEYLKDTKVNVYTVHPGLVDTDLSRDIPIIPCCFKCIVTLLSCKRYISPQNGAATTLYCCLEQSISSQSGKYYSDCQETTPKPYAIDKENARKLWNLSLQICSLSEEPEESENSIKLEFTTSVNGNTQEQTVMTVNENLDNIITNNNDQEILTEESISKAEKRELLTGLDRRENLISKAI